MKKKKIAQSPFKKNIYRLIDITTKLTKIISEMNDRINVLEERVYEQTKRK